MANTDSALSLQQTFAPDSICFGCGPANKKGLQIASFASEDEQGAKLVATWHAKAHHQAFPGILNGGIIGALLDCHANWTACWHLMIVNKKNVPPCTVTAWFNVTLHRPTPCDKPINLTARPIKTEDRKVTVAATLEVDGKLCASCEGLFIAVKKEHPALKELAL